MIQLLPLSGDVNPAVRSLGWDWAIEDACQNYVAREAVQLPEATADALLQAADTLYDLLVQSIPDPIPDDLLRLLAIPKTCGLPSATPGTTTGTGTSTAASTSPTPPTAPNSSNSTPTLPPASPKRPWCSGPAW